MVGTRLFLFLLLALAMFLAAGWRTSLVGRAPSKNNMQSVDVKETVAIVPLRNKSMTTVNTTAITGTTGSSSPNGTTTSASHAPPSSDTDTQGQPGKTTTMPTILVSTIPEVTPSASPLLVVSPTTGSPQSVVPSAGPIIAPITRSTTSRPSIGTLAPTITSSAPTVSSSTPTVLEAAAAGTDTDIPVVASSSSVIPAAITTKETLDVLCGREFYCNTSKCQKIQLPENVDLDEVEAFLHNAGGTANGTTLRHREPFRFHYWGDSVQQTMECDMRQWDYEKKQQVKQQQQQGELSPDADAVVNFTFHHSTYYRVGCPWNKCDPEIGWKGLEQATLVNPPDGILFNIGAHYEFLTEQEFEKEVQKYEDLLTKYIMLNNNVTTTNTRRGGIVIVRGPSPTHFETATGLANLLEREALATKYDRKTPPLNITGKNVSVYKTGCAPPARAATSSAAGANRTTDRFPSPIIAHQDKILRALVDHLNAHVVGHNNVDDRTTVVSSSTHARRAGGIAVYLDVYSISRDRWMEHFVPDQLIVDCKHFCQNCGLLRAWNVIAMAKIMEIVQGRMII